MEKIRKKNLNIDLGVLKFHDFVPHLSLARWLDAYDSVKFINRKDSFFPQNELVHLFCST